MTRGEIKMILFLVGLSVAVTIAGSHFGQARAKWQFWRSDHTNAGP